MRSSMREPGRRWSLEQDPGALTSWTVRLGRHRIGFTHDVIEHDGAPYLERWILWFGASLRLHRFLASDEDRAVHDHPWWFVTLPFHGYQEQYDAGDGTLRERRVAPLRLHFRRGRLRHRVRIARTPTWTLVLTGAKSKDWGFWEQDSFTHHEQWRP